MRPITNLLAFSLLTAAVSAQSSLCMSASNSTAYDTLVSMGGPNLLLAIKLQAPTALVVTRLEVFTGEQTGANTLGIWSHNATTNMPLLSLTTGQWNMSQANGWQGANVSPILVPSGTDFWLVWGMPNGAQASVEAQQHPLAQYYRGSFDGGQNWNGGATGWRAELWKLRIRCGGSPGAYEVFGSGCPGSSRSRPQLGFSDAPSIGQTMEVNLTQGLAASAALLSIGTSATSWLGTPLPLDLAPFGAPSCSILCSANAFIIVQTSATGTAAVPLNLPADPSLVGGSLFNQWWAIDLNANPLGIAFSNGGRGTIGN